MKNKYLRLLALPLLAFLAGCFSEPSNPWDPATKLETPRELDMNYQDSLGYIGPDYVQLKWERTTDPNFFFYIVCRTETDTPITRALSDDEHADLVEELSSVDADEMWTIENSTNMRSKMPALSRIFHAVAVYPDPGQVEYWDAEITTNTRYYYTVVVMLKNLGDFVVNPTICVDTPPDLWGWSAGGCEMLFPYRDQAQSVYEIQLDDYDNIYISGYSWGANYPYVPAGTPLANNYFVIAGSLTNAFISNMYLYEWNAMVMSGATNTNADIQRFKGFAVNSDGTELYIAETKFPQWKILKLNLPTWDLNDVTIADSVENAGPGFNPIDDYTSYLYLDEYNDELWVLGDDLYLLEASTLDVIVRVPFSTTVRLNGIAKDSLENLYVSDAEQNVVLKMVPDGFLSWSYTVFAGEAGLSSSKYGEFNNPTGVAVDAYDNVYIADTGNHRVQKYNSAGEWISSINMKALLGNAAEFPRALKIRNGTLYVGCAQKIFSFELY